MPSRILMVPVVALALLLIARPHAGAADNPSPKQLMQFGADAAKDGLWREATLRWERARQRDPNNARLLNNLAVAYESAGRFEEADRAYREARRLDPERKSIRENHESFLKLHPQFLEPPAEATDATDATDAADAADTAGAPAKGETPHAP